VPADALIRIAEDPDDNYSQSFADSAGSGGKNDTGFRAAGAGAAARRVFEFFNAQIVDPVPTGIEDSAERPGAGAGTILLLTLSGWLAVEIVMKKLSAR